MAGLAGSCSASLNLLMQYIPLVCFASTCAPYPVLLLSGGIAAEVWGWVCTAALICTCEWPATLNTGLGRLRATLIVLISISVTGEMVLDRWCCSCSFCSWWPFCRCWWWLWVCWWLVCGPNGRWGLWHCSRGPVALTVVTVSSGQTT